MIIHEEGAWVVMDTNTKEVISEHPFDPTSDYQKAKAKQAALASNEVWKSQQ